MKVIDGFVAEFAHTTVISKDLTNVGVARETAIDLTGESGYLTRVEVLIGGYDDDPRPLYMVPEVRRWMGAIADQWIDWLFWLTPGSLRIWLLGVNSSMIQQLADGRLKFEIDSEQILTQIADSWTGARALLQERGIDEDRIVDREDSGFDSVETIFSSGGLGEDYVVVHPIEGEIVHLSED